VRSPQAHSEKEGKVARLVGRDGFVKATEIGNRTYHTDRKGLYLVENSSDIAAMKREGFTEASLNPYQEGDITRGFTCIECGFGSWFRKCSRCGFVNGTPARDGE
jgi:hypothetical protein